MQLGSTFPPPSCPVIPTGNAPEQPGHGGPHIKVATQARARGGDLLHGRWGPPCQCWPVLGADEEAASS
eukprot:scaffold32390_cov16-Tisochrysis_lutea.AAC.1